MNRFYMWLSVAVLALGGGVAAHFLGMSELSTALLGAFAGQVLLRSPVDVMPAKPEAK